MEHAEDRRAALEAREQAPALSPKDRTSSTKLFGRLSHGDDIDEEAEEEDDEFEFDDDT